MLRWRERNSRKAHQALSLHRLHKREHGPSTSTSPRMLTAPPQYVHVKCLQRWRTRSTGHNAFYCCPQCKFHYRFARTKAVGLATNPSMSRFVVGVLFCSLNVLSSSSWHSLFFPLHAAGHALIIHHHLFSELYRGPADVRVDLLLHITN